MVMRGGCDRMLKFCNCSCHKPGNTKTHVVACCEGQCLFCKMFIKSDLQNHMENCGPKCGSDVKRLIGKYLKRPT